MGGKGGREGGREGREVEYIYKVIIHFSFMSYLKLEADEPFLPKAATGPPPRSSTNPVKQPAIGGTWSADLLHKKRERIGFHPPYSKRHIYI